MFSQNLGAVKYIVAGKTASYIMSQVARTAPENKMHFNG
jgi:hypothetical protein